jgi:hypothetical protein
MVEGLPDAARVMFDDERAVANDPATRADTGEVLNIRAQRSANTSRGALRFAEEAIPRLTRAGATGPKLLRADSGFENKKICARLQAAGWTYSIGAHQHKHIKAATADIPKADWTRLGDHPKTGEAQIAQTSMLGYQRLVVRRRTRLLGDQAELWPDWWHFAFLTNRTDALELVEAEHCQHVVVELAIRDLKDQALKHFPSGKSWLTPPGPSSPPRRTTSGAEQR